MSSVKIVSPETIDAFIKECVIVKILPNEVCLTLDLTKLVNFYRIRIGIHPVLESWGEIQQLLDAAIRAAKQVKPQDIPFNIRFVGGDIHVWLSMKIYALCVYQADALFYAGDAIIKL